jgi:hypothetical protein
MKKNNFLKGFGHNVNLKKKTLWHLFLFKNLSIAYQKNSSYPHTQCHFANHNPYIHNITLLNQLHNILTLTQFQHLIKK